MKQFYCGAVIPGCKAHFTADSEAQILQQVAEHAKRDHQLNEVPPEVVAKVRSLIQDTR